jgi:type II secretory ATPase GspE/PulE/Tfp pilus assembly ATPase PilB-like protein
LVASALSALIGQRIARKICPSCKQEYIPEEPIVDDIRKVLGPLIPNDREIKLYRGSGQANGQPCVTCGSSGYVGRMGIFEVFSISDAMSKLILSRSAMSDIEKKAVEEGMITMKQDGYLKAIEGMTSIEEVLRVAQD